MSNLAAVIVPGALVVVLACAIVAAALWGRRRELALRFVVAGAGLALGIGVAALVEFVSTDTGSTVSVPGLTDERDGLSLALSHERLGVDANTYSFGTSIGWEKLTGKLDEAYPGGTISGNTWTVAQGGAIFTVTNDPRYGADSYVLTAHVATVKDAQGKAIARVPFPAAVATTLENGKPIEASLSLDQWRAFYAPLGIADAEGTFSVSAAPVDDAGSGAGGAAAVTVTGTMVAVTVS